jgi:aerobic-type carbon monoxide dehydrogenase small subunit (CoxS/CutS family)
MNLPDNTAVVRKNYSSVITIDFRNKKSGKLHHRAFRENQITLFAKYCKKHKITCFVGLAAEEAAAMLRASELSVWNKQPETEKEVAYA